MVGSAHRDHHAVRGRAGLNQSRDNKASRQTQCDEMKKELPFQWTDLISNSTGDDDICGCCRWLEILTIRALMNHFKFITAIKRMCVNGRFSIVCKNIH